MKKILIVVLILFAINACKKESNQPENLPANPKYKIYSGVESAGVDSVYEAITDSELVDFTEKIIEDEWTNEMSFNKALFISEVYSNLVISIIDVYDKIDEVKSQEFTLAIGVTQEAGERIISGANLQGFVDEIYSECETRLNEVSFLSSGDGNDKFIQVVDLEWDEDNNSETTQYVNVRIVLAKEAASVGCDVQNDWYGYHDGGCNGNNNTTTNSRKRMEARLNSSYCNPSVGCQGYAGTGTYYTYNNVSWEKYQSYVEHGQSKIWLGKEWDCLSPTELDDYIDGAEDASLSVQPSGKATLSYVIYTDVIQGVCNENNGDKCYLHRMDFQYGQCKKLSFETLAVYNDLKAID